MTRDETIALFLDCEAKRKEAGEAALARGADRVDVINAAHAAARAHWNAWADRMIAEREALVASGRWASSTKLRPENAETRAWIEAAAVDFTSVHFQISSSNGLEQPKLGDAQEIRDRSFGRPIHEWWQKRYPIKQVVIEGTIDPEISMTSYVFPGRARFSEARFEGFASFSGATFWDVTVFDGAMFEGGAGLSSDFRNNVVFWDAVFSENVSFQWSSFSGRAQFGGTNFSNAKASFKYAVFKDGADFSNITFGKTANFDNVSFMDEADFRDVTFKGGSAFKYTNFEKLASFSRSTFEEFCDFSGANFKDEVWFSTASFNGDIRFHSTTFCKSAFFRDTTFGPEQARADFTGTKADRVFDLTGAHFRETPNFSQADFKQAPDLDGVYFPLPSAEPLTSGDHDLIPKYRALRRMAIQGADYEREQMAFKGELRSRRWVEDTWRHPSLWLGILYDLAADCGRSVGRPFAIWLTSIFVFAILYIPSSRRVWDACSSGDSAFWNSLYLSGRNALVVSTAGKSETAAEAYRCLFDKPNPSISVSFVEILRPGSALGGADFPVPARGQEQI